MILNLPSPPGMDVSRDYSGGYGNAHWVDRNDYGHSSEVLLPLFMPYLATKIKREGYDLTILDAQAVRLSSADVIKEIKNKQPKFIISMISLPSIYGDIRLLNRLKENFPQTLLIVVGTATKFLAEEILHKSEVDFLVDGQYPFYSNPIIRLIQAIEKKSIQSIKAIPGLIYKKEVKGNILIKHNPLQGLQIAESLDDLDIRIYHEFPVEAYELCFFDLYGRPLKYFPILSGKGCPFPCIYCPYPIGFGKKISYKSPVSLVNEMEYLNKNFGIVAFLFRDQVFTMNSGRIEEICNLITERNLKVNWLFETRADKISKSLLGKMKKAGCNRIHYGIETGDEKLLRKIGKPGVDKQVIKQVFKDTAEAGIYTMAHVIFGLPGEDEETLKSTYNFLLEINPDGVNWNLVTPYPGTKLFEMAKHRNLILTYDWSKYNTRDIVMRTERLSGAKLMRIKKRLYRDFTIRQIIRRLQKALHNKKELGFLFRRFVYQCRLKLGFWPA